MNEQTTPRHYAFPWEFKNGSYIRRLFKGKIELLPVAIHFDSKSYSWTGAPNSAMFYAGQSTSYEAAMSKVDRRLKKMGYIFIKPNLVVMF